MAKERMITRTITITTAKALCVAIDTQQTYTETLQVTGSYVDNATLLSDLQQIYGSDNNRIVAILETEEVEKLYAMPETVFVSMATEIPPRTKAE